MNSNDRKLSSISTLDNNRDATLGYYRVIPLTKKLTCTFSS